MLKSLQVLVVATVFFSCQPKENTSSVGLDGWLKGSTDEKFDELADQQAGFGRAMMEVGYRYQELYWAGMEANWGYAEHQLEEIHEVIELALVRRPLRAASAQAFMEHSLPEMEKVVAQQDTVLFAKAFVAFTANCNACHIRENMPYINVEIPQMRLSPVRKQKSVE